MKRGSGLRGGVSLHLWRKTAFVGFQMQNGAILVVFFAITFIKLGSCGFQPLNPPRGFAPAWTNLFIYLVYQICQDIKTSGTLRNAGISVSALLGRI